MKKVALAFICICLWTILALIGVAFAADATAPAASSGIMAGFLNNTLFPFLTALLMGLITYGAKLLATKYNLQILADNNDMLMKLAAQGIAFAEEKAATFADSKVPLNGNDKMTQAVSYIINAMPKVTPEQAQNAVHAVLAMIPGAGASGASTFVPAATTIPAPAATTIPTAS